MPLAENQLLAGLPRQDRLRLVSMSDSVELVRGEVLCEAGDALRHVHFPRHGCLSLVAVIDDGAALEVGMVGREGMLGAQLALGLDTCPLRVLVQGEGAARRIGMTAFCRVLAEVPALQVSLNRYLFVLMVQLATSVACTRYHHVGPRLARQLLMSHDRAHADRFHLTHAFLADMLGVRRVGITGAAGELQRLGLIRYHRGEITVVDRLGLERVACSCYGADCRAYAQQLGQPLAGCVDAALTPSLP